MEFQGQAFMEDQCLMFETRKLCEPTVPPEMNDRFSFPSAWGVDHVFDESADFLSQEELSVFNEVYDPLRDRLLVPQASDSYPYSPRKIAEYSSSSPNDGSLPLPLALHEDLFPCASHCLLEEEDGLDAVDGFQALEAEGACKAEPTAESPGHVPVFSTGPVPGHGRKGRTKVSGGQQSKNLMAERRRRKRLNDRLSMLRSIVPKISKMDRTSILGDTIDYMKELLQKIDDLQHQLGLSPNQIRILDIVKDMKPNEMLVRNSPKFKVEKTNEDASIEVCCGMKPGLLLSTVNTMESLGLEIQQCVISCFGDFAMQASCSHQQGSDQTASVTAGDIKQALFRNAGYGGKCL